MKGKAAIGLRALGMLGGGIIFLILCGELWSHWTALKGYSWKLSLPIGLLSFGALLGSLFLLPWGLKVVLALLGHPIPFFRMGKILFLSLMAKYLPGGWWTLVGRAHLYRQEGLTLAQASVAVFLETILIVTAGIFVFAIFSLGSSSFLWDLQKIFLIVLGSVCLFLIHPLFLNLLLSLAERIFKKPVTPLQYPYRKIAYPFFIFFLFWLGMGTSFWLLADSLLGLKLTALPRMVSAFALSWVLGFLSLVTPGGLGVREGALTLLLKPYLPFYTAVALGLLSRLWWMGGEILGLVISLLAERSFRGGFRILSRKERGKLALPSLPGEKRKSLV